MTRPSAPPEYRIKNWTAVDIAFPAEWGGLDSPVVLLREECRTTTELWAGGPVRIVDCEEPFETRDRLHESADRLTDGEGDAA